MNFKSITLVVAFLVSCMNMVSAQEQQTYPSKVSAKIFSNFNYGITGDHASAFELQRAYFGYEKQISEHFSANVKLDVGSPDDISEFSRLRRYAYFKNAGISYTNNNLTIWGGLFDMQQFKVQEKFWGYRYLMKSFMDEYKFGPSADIGVGMKYKFSEQFEGDFILSNGEGYSSPQRDNTYKTGFGLTYKTLEFITLRAYYSIFAASVPQMTMTGFAGFSFSSFRLGVEYNYQHNYNFNEDNDRFGYSLFGTYVINDQWEFFGRFDKLASNILEEQTIPWNLAKDGSALVGGIQFSPIPKVHMALNYQDWVEYASNGGADRVLYLSLEVNF